MAKVIHEVLSLFLRTRICPEEYFRDIGVIGCTCFFISAESSSSITRRSRSERGVMLAKLDPLFIPRCGATLRICYKIDIGDLRQVHRRTRWRIVPSSD